MPLEATMRSYGTYFSDLSHPERRAAIRYIEELARHYPDLSAEVAAGPGNEGAVYVYAPLPADDDRNIEVHETMARAAIDILLDTGVSIALMPGPE